MSEADDLGPGDFPCILRKPVEYNELTGAVRKVWDRQGRLATSQSGDSPRRLCLSAEAQWQEVCPIPGNAVRRRDLWNPALTF